ncbi:MAG: ATP-binding protein, partial [Bacteroidota bacterium]
DASHELRTPLTIMRGEIEVALRGHRLNAPTRELLGSVHDELVRLSSIVESLMTLVKSDSGRLVFDVQDVSLNQIIGQIAADAQMLAEGKKIAINVVAAAPVRVNGDAKRLRQLFLSLVENAIKFSSPRGAITLALEQQNGNAVVNITDTGAGISRKDQPRIFDRFYRGRQPKNGEFGGSGLGLSIAKWIAEAHRGTIEVKSRAGKGSTFTVKLPSTSGGTDS